jgi:hypothetical protein
MLDTDTKRRIDTARDILVGKVPDPKSQKVLLIDLGRKDLIWGERRGRLSEEEWLTSIKKEEL